MEQEFEFGKLSETEDYTEHVAEVQDRIIIKILNEVEKGIESEAESVTLTELVETDDFIIAKKAILEAKDVYSGMGLPLQVDFFSVQSEDKTIEQGFRINIDLQPDQTEIAE